jgi:hypothetical protein
LLEVPRFHRLHTREDSGLVLDRHGVWWHDGVRVTHPRILDAFQRGLSPTDDGRYRLDFGNDWCFVEVEDAAYQVLGVGFAHAEHVLLSLSDGTHEPLAVESLHVDSDGILACQVKGGRAKARFSRTAQFALGDRIEARAGTLILRWAGRERALPGLPPSSLG